MAKFVGKFALVLSALIAVSACENRTKKATIHKGRGDGTGGSNEWAKDVQGADNTGCMRLVMLAQLVRNIDLELISVHTMDLDFVTVNREATTASQLSPDRKTVTRAHGQRISFPRVEGVTDAMKINYFFRDSFLPVAETVPSRATLASKQAARLMAVKGQVDCDSVTFDGDKKFTVVHGSKNSIQLELDKEIRTYVLLPNDQVLMTEAILAQNIPSCPGSPSIPGNAYVLRSYILSKSRNKQRFQITKNLAHLYRYVHDTQELLGSRAAAPAATPAPRTPAPAAERARSGGGDLVLLSGSTLQFLSDELLKPATRTGMTCDRAAIARP